MSAIQSSFHAFLTESTPFKLLSPSALTRLSNLLQPLRYRMGQTLLTQELMPDQVLFLYEGQARLVAYQPQSYQPTTLQRLQPGDVIGWASLLRGVPCETAIASTEAICLTLPAEIFLTLLEQEPAFALEFKTQCSLAEVYSILSHEYERRADSQLTLQVAGVANLKELALQVQAKAITQTFIENDVLLEQLDSEFTWFMGSDNVCEVPIGKALALPEISKLKLQKTEPVRLIGLHLPKIDSLPVQENAFHPEAIPYAPALSPNRLADSKSQSRSPDPQKQRYPFISGKGALEATLACFRMLSKYWNIPLKRDVVERTLTTQIQRTQTLSLELCGAVTELMGLQTQLITLPISAIGQIQLPAMIRWRNSFAIVYECNNHEVLLAIPEEGLLCASIADFASVWGDEGQALLCKPTQSTPSQRFTLRWFFPFLWRYRRVLSEVLIASLFVQLFSLASPLLVQLIIDKVIIQNSLGTLDILGILLILVAVFEGILTVLRTYLFVDTTNRLDMALGTEIIDHLLRLPLRYFERRPVGELATRTNELENIRQFLTGTALTGVLDAVFSVVYIIVMMIYSWLLTLVALATVPLFALLTFIMSPIVRRQLRHKTERNSQSQSYLVEVLSGIQTVKAQNLELRSRWQWQEHYAQYVSAGFQTVTTATATSVTSTFLNKISGLLVLWVGAYLVLNGQLTLGQLIAFRILAGYVTNPLLRLTQLWQNFQQLTLSIERLADILNTLPEANEIDRHNIPMPTIQGNLTYENVSFRFNPAGPLQLSHVNLNFTAGQFVGIVGKSGSGKSTITKLLPRLYEPTSGRILIDGFDIAKVELYSLRQQIGVVLQDTLLFDGTVRENIALSNPDATAEEVIAAAKIAVAHDFIMSLPNGYNTRVGERGSVLSGGQRQRIAIARIVLQNPRILILDEATSALDYESERQVCLNLATEFRDRTILFITHRLTTLKNADVILLVEQGAIVEQGTHTELIADKGRYYCLYHQQEFQV
jgi:ATP-binding cassette subfamily B protein